MWNVASDAPPAPPSLAGVLGGLNDIVSKAVPAADNQAALKAITDDGLTEAENQITTASQDSLVASVVKTLVDARLNTFIHTGMCRRNYSAPCPVGWTKEDLADGSVSCSSGSLTDSSSSACSSYTMSDAWLQPAKEAFALKCKVEWPCAACKRDFSNCPKNFQPETPNVIGICVPTKSYMGPCPERVDFSKTKNTVDKARWAAFCYTSWPCSPE
jgi:CPW-WPC domain-containing protein